MWKDLTMQQRAELMDIYLQHGITSLDDIRRDYDLQSSDTVTAYPEDTNEYAHGGSIYIKPSHRGRFTRLKERTGHSASWFKEHGTPAQKKMATFALNAAKWKHGYGGNLYDGTSQPTQQMDNSYTYYKPLENIFVDSEGNLRDPEVPRARGTIQLPEVTVSMRDPRKPVPTANVLNPSSLSLSNFLDKDKIYNRIPGDEWYNVVNEDRKSNYGISGPLDALQAYFSNDDDYVLNRLSRYMPYKDISWREKEKAAQDFYEEGRNVKYKFDTLSDAAKHRLEMLQDKSEALPILQHEDAKAVYLGLPQRTNTLRDAEYTPTQGKLNNGKYITYMREPTFVEDVLMPIYNDLKLGRKRIGGKKVAGEVLSLPKYVNSIEEITPKGNAVVHIPFLNNATMSSGHDDRGEYLSIFDTWDYNTGVYAKPGDNIGKYIDGKPFDIYDRIYLDDYYNIPDKYKGSSYLPEATVYGKKKKP